MFCTFGVQVDISSSCPGETSSWQGPYRLNHPRAEALAPDMSELRLGLVQDGGVV